MPRQNGGKPPLSQRPRPYQYVEASSGMDEEERTKLESMVKQLQAFSTKSPTFTKRLLGAAVVHFIFIFWVWVCSFLVKSFFEAFVLPFFLLSSAVGIWGTLAQREPLLRISFWACFCELWSLLGQFLFAIMFVTPIFMSDAEYLRRAQTLNVNATWPYVIFLLVRGTLVYIQLYVTTRLLGKLRASSETRGMSGSFKAKLLGGNRRGGNSRYNGRGRTLARPQQQEQEATENEEEGEAEIQSDDGSEEDDEDDRRRQYYEGGPDGDVEVGGQQLPPVRKSNRTRMLRSFHSRDDGTLGLAIQ